MTRTEAADIITKAIASAGPIAGTLSIDAFAQRTAAALDALGLLEFAHIDQPAVEPTGAKSPDINTPVETPMEDIRQQAKTARNLADNNYRPDITPIEPWATQRIRT